VFYTAEVNRWYKMNDFRCIYTAEVNRWYKMNDFRCIYTAEVNRLYKINDFRWSILLKLIDDIKLMILGFLYCIS